LPDADDKKSILLDTIKTVTDRLHDASDEDEAFHSIAKGLREVSGADYSGVLLLDEDHAHLRLVGMDGPRDVPKDEFANYRAAMSIQTALQQEVRSSTIKWETPEQAPEAAGVIMRKYGMVQGMLFSLVYHGRLLGYLVIGNLDGRPPFDKDTEDAVKILADYVSVAADSVRSEYLAKRDQEERHRVLSIAPIGIMSLDPKGIVLSVNKQMLGVFERDREEDMVGTSIFEIAAVHRSGMDVLVIQGMEGHASEKVDLHYVPRQDKAFYLHVKVTPLLSDKGDVQGVVLVAMDTTSKVRLESQLERSYEKLTQTYQELERVTKMKSQFIDVVSHELRTPLTVMRGYVDLVEGEYAPMLDPKFGQRLKIIKANTDKLYALVESMLDISRLEKGSLEIHTEPMKVDTILEDMVNDRLKDAEEKKQTLTLSVDGAIPIVVADRRRMRDVFNNLIDNAIKYTEEGGRIQVGCRDEGRIVHVWVKDNGIGIPLENLGRIFDRFYIVSKDDLAHQVDRIGLSLPIAKGIVEAHGGRLWVESQVGKGSVFHVDIPKESPK